MLLKRTFYVFLSFSLKVNPKEVVVDAGQRLELRCHVTGQPVDSVTWYKDGTIVR